MTDYTQKTENNWPQTVSAFRAYLHQTVALLAHSKQTVAVDESASPKSRKVKSRKHTPVTSGMGYQAQFVYLLPAGQQRPVSEPSATRHFSSPLWVGIGDEELKSKRKPA